MDSYSNDAGSLTHGQSARQRSGAGWCARIVAALMILTTQARCAESGGDEPEHRARDAGTDTRSPGVSGFAPSSPATGGNGGRADQGATGGAGGASANLLGSKSEAGRWGGGSSAAGGSRVDAGGAVSGGRGGAAIAGSGGASPSGGGPGSGGIGLSGGAPGSGGSSPAGGPGSGGMSPSGGAPGSGGSSGGAPGSGGTSQTGGGSMDSAGGAGSHPLESEPCSPAEDMTGGQSGNFDTTGAVCKRTADAIAGWGCSSFDGRTVKVNGALVACGTVPLPPKVNGYYYFDASAGTHSWAAIYWW